MNGEREREIALGLDLGKEMTLLPVSTPQEDRKLPLRITKLQFSLTPSREAKAKGNEMLRQARTATAKDSRFIKWIKFR